MMKKILIVDDQMEVRELVEVTLRVDGYEIFQAESGEKAIEIAKSENIPTYKVANRLAEARVEKAKGGKMKARPW